MHEVCLHNLKNALMILMRLKKALYRVNFVAHFDPKTQTAKRCLGNKTACNIALAKYGAGHWNFSISNISSLVMGLDRFRLNLIGSFN